MKLDDPNFCCKNCVYWSQIYVHPWSKVSEDLKSSYNGYACLLALDKEFVESFNKGTGITYEEDRRVEVLIGMKDSCGCENMMEKDKYNLTVKLERKNV